MSNWNERIDNIEQCKRIANHLEACYNGRVFKCPECERLAINPEGLCCCGNMEDKDEWEQVSLLEDEEIFDTEFRVGGGDMEYRSVALMIACGGPNIYVDTESRSVNLYWWGDSASFPLSTDLCNEIDELFEAEYEARKDRVLNEKFIHSRLALWP